MGTLGRIVREPLLHFAVLGALLFALAGGSAGSRDGDRRLVVSRGQIEQLATTFARTWQRPPTRAELDGLIDDWIRTEVAYRQALALGIDDGDVVVRRRLRQKLEFLTEDVTDTEPTEDDLAAYLAEHPDDFATPTRYTFTQIYLSPTRRRDSAGDATALVARLNGDATIDPRDVGDPLLVPGHLDDAPRSEVASIFGTAFADALASAPLGQWSGPIESGYGLHVVRVDRRVDGAVPTLDTVRAVVAREWQNARRTQLLEDAYERMRAQYDVVIEPFEAGQPSADAPATP